MGALRQRPSRLGEKLLAVRTKLGYSQTEMADALSDDESSVARQDIHRFEKNERDPNYIIMLRYCRLSKIDFEYFADDNLDLPW